MATRSKGRSAPSRRWPGATTRSVSGAAAPFNLGPGVYTITAGFTNSGGGTINGTAASTIYLCPGATFDLSGSSSTTLSSPSGSPAS